MGRKGIHYYIRCEYEIIDKFKDKYSISYLCNLMSVSRSGYYKWKYLTVPFEVIVSDMTAFWVKNTYWELTLYFDAWNKEIVGYGLDSRKGSIKTYFDGLNQVLSKIKNQTSDLVILHKD